MKVICTSYINCKNADRCSHSKPHEKIDSCGVISLDIRYCLFVNKYVSCQPTIKEIRKQKLEKIQNGIYMSRS